MIATPQAPWNLIPGYDPAATAGDSWFDEEAARNACEFFPVCLKHVEGAVAGEPFVLEPWQQAIIGNLFGWKRKDKRDRTIRRYRQAFIYVPRKNGKTPLVAGISLYVLFCDPERGQQNYIAAAEREQAGMLFRQAKGMVEQESNLDSRCRIYGGTASAGQSRSIVREADGSFLRVISADAATKHGQTPHLVVIDEVHTQPNRELVDVLRTGFASQNRMQPLFIGLTTADYDRDDSICNEWYEYACQVRDGKVSDPTFLPVIYDASETKDDWTDPAVWARVNPNLNVSVSEEYLRSECEKAKANPRLQNTFKRLHLNMRTRQDVLWLDMDAWQECEVESLELPASVPVYGGLDLSSKIDITALVWAWRNEKKMRIKARFWLPADRIRELETKHHDPRFRIWRDKGFLFETPGNTIDYEFIRATILGESKGLWLGEIGYDPWNAAQVCNALFNNDGLPMVEFRQGYVSMNEPSKEFERLIVAGELEHEKNPVLDWMAENVMVRPDPSGNIKPVKPDPSGKLKIDGIVAAIMAVGRASLSDAIGSAYSDRGMLSAADILAMAPEEEPANA